MSRIDWTINLVFIGGMFVIAWYSKRYMKGVADFVAANRLAGRYLTTIAAGLQGAIAIVAAWEVFYKAGFPSQWWALMSTPAVLFLAITGFIVYRFRQTRALTLAQFFEIRYSRNFRIFSGGLCFLSGILNYGVFPMVTANFLICFLCLPPAVDLGILRIGTFPLIMAIELSVALLLILPGGHITILLTEFYQGMVTLILFVVLVAYMMLKFSWPDVVAGLQVAPVGKSMLNPLQAGQTEDFNAWYFLILLFGTIYNARSWQGASAYNACPRTPHEAKMAGIISSWRLFTQNLLYLIIPAAAYAIMHLPKFAPLADPIRRQIDAIADPQLRTQMTVPIVLTHLLPVGMMGLFAGVIFASAVHVDESYLHSWGTIFVQDILAPCLKKPLSPKAHLRLLRLSIVGVALFGFVFSLVFTLRDYLVMYFSLTGAIYLGGAGAVIIGGLYWKRGTTLAAWVALILGSVLAFGGLGVQQLWPGTIVPRLMAWYPQSHYLQQHATKFPINGAAIYFYAMLASSVAYVLVSLLGLQRAFDMDKLLHRGRYAVAEDQVRPAAGYRPSWLERLGLTSEFTRSDRALFYATIAWNLGWWLVFLIGTIGGMVFVISDAIWAGFWWLRIWLSFILGILITLWLFWGGIRDFRQLFVDLQRVRRDETDDGTVPEPQTK